MTDIILFSTNWQISIIIIASLLMGSFISLLTYRINSKEPIIFTRSKCINCNKILNAFNLIPLLSWIIQRGKCGKCKAKISWRYPLIEASFLVFFVATYFILEKKFDLTLLLYLSIATILIFMCIVDLEHYYIPNISQFILTILIVILLLKQGTNKDLVFDVLKSSFLYLFFGLALWALFYFGGGLEAIGIDDLKFFFIAGLGLGFDDFLNFTLFSGIFGLIFGSIWQKLKKDDFFPFAPAICLSFYICLIIDGFGLNSIIK